MLPELGNAQSANLMPTAKAKPTEVMVVPAAAGKAAAQSRPPPLRPSSSPARRRPLGKPGMAPAAPIGALVGYRRAKLRRDLERLQLWDMLRRQAR